MFLKVVLAVLCCSVAIANASNYDSYEGYKIYEINAKNEFEKEFLHRLSQNDVYDFFTLPKLLGRATRIMVQPEEQKTFESTLSNFGLDYTVINANVGESVQTERMQNLMLRTVFKGTPRVSFSNYLRFDAINAYLDQLASDYSSRVKVQSIGKSYEGRDLKTITISNGDGRAGKKVILVDAGIHAREWITHSTVLYIIQELVENYAENVHLLKNYDWVVLPVVNPDGYEYSHTNERFWRKTRKPVNSKDNGTDANRNFDFHWGEEGASSDPWDITFRGVQPFSEPETQTLRDLMLSLSGRATMYLNLHSSGGCLLIPWSYANKLPDTWRDIHAVAQAGANAIKSATGTEYMVNNTFNAIKYSAAGTSQDYAFAVAKIPISITMELPNRELGFDPAPELIHPIVEESWVGIKAMAEKVVETY